jgi:hypothetical protein
MKTTYLLETVFTVGLSDMLYGPAPLLDAIEPADEARRAEMAGVDEDRPVDEVGLAVLLSS